MYRIIKAAAVVELVWSARSVQRAAAGALMAFGMAGGGRKE